MKILKSLTTAAAVLLIAGCTGSGTEDETMPVPVHERETERVAVDVNPAVGTPVDAETTREPEKPQKTQKTDKTSEQQTGECVEATPETGKAARGAEKHEGQTVTAPAVAEAAQKTETSSEIAAEKKEESVPEGISGTPSETTTEEVSETTPGTTSEASAKDTPDRQNLSGKGHLFAGIEGGLAFAESSFSSFGAGGSHSGGSGSLFAGYRFNGWLSLELFSGIGGTRMSARKCCSEANLWLSTDGEQFRAAVLGKEGAYYSELESAVLWQHYGLRLNFNLLGLIPATQDGKWSLELSPAVSALGPSAKVRTAAAKKTVFCADNWQIGLGGRIQAGYAILPWMNAGLYSGLTFGTGGHIDALPADDHKSNFIWESGVRLTFSIPDKTRK